MGKEGAEDVYISEDQIKKILRNHEKMLKSIRTRMLLLYEEAEVPEELIKEIAFPDTKMTGTQGPKGTYPDLGDVCESIRNRKYRKDEEIREAMWQLTEEEERVNRVWICFCALEDPYFTILQQLYVKNEKYETVEKEFEMSHKTFEKHRAEGIRLLKAYYESGDSAADLMRKRYIREHPRAKKKKSTTESSYQQLSFFTD